MRRRNRLLSALALVSAPAIVTAPSLAQEERPDLALMGTVPIYWGEAAGLDEVLSGDAPLHWARAVLEEDFTLTPLDYLSEDALAGHSFLMMAQPRGLSAEENVALDAWVRGGGSLLLFADPMMTGESRFHIGDRRRPQDVALLSPLLAHWGLELHFDPGQPGGQQTVDHFGDALPVNMRGELRSTGQSGPCSIPGDGLLAHCVIGDGQAMIVADAAMLDLAGPHIEAEGALRWLVSHVFAKNGDGAGNAMRERSQGRESGANSSSGHAARHEGHSDEGANTD